VVHPKNAINQPRPLISASKNTASPTTAGAKTSKNRYWSLASGHWLLIALLNPPIFCFELINYLTIQRFDYLINFLLGDDSHKIIDVPLIYSIFCFELSALPAQLNTKPI